MRKRLLPKIVLLVVLLVLASATIIIRSKPKAIEAANVVWSVQTPTTTPRVVPAEATPEVTITDTETAEVSTKVVSIIPVRIRISAIGVDAHIESLGLTKLGAMDSPVGPENAAWYKFGPKPGQIGSAVIDGHFGWKNDIPAVFDNLSNLKKGDKIQTIDEGGRVTTFIVRETKVLANDADATAVFSSTDRKAHLNLITCSGKWDTTTKNRPSRLVVFTDKAV